MLSLSLSTSRRGAYVVVEVTGDLDMSTAPALREELLIILWGEGRDIILDLTGVGFADSFGVHAVVAAHRWARLRGGSLCLSSPSAQVGKVLRITGIDQRIPTFPSISAAMAAD
ncbi:MAG: anti-sigma factor antagonist [Streptosporangiales bacterium]|nr:anti-sigma factor antagonist [Streptosporangiales bacterium]